MFSKASKNINVQKTKSGNVEMVLNDKDGIEITNKSFSLKRKKDSKINLQYGSFLKSSVLLANVGKEQAIQGQKICTDDIEIKPVHFLSDEDLFKACRGRTAHKGARHGLNLTGKLQRIAEQEKVLLEKMKRNQNQDLTLKKKHRENTISELNSKNSDDDIDVKRLLFEEPPDYILKRSKKRKKLDRSTELSLVEGVGDIGLDAKPFVQKSVVIKEEAPIQEKKKSRKKKKRNSFQEINLPDELCKEIMMPKQFMPTNKVKKRKKNSEESGSNFELKNANLSSGEQLTQSNEKRKIEGEFKAKQRRDSRLKKIKLSSSDDEDDVEDIVEKINSAQEACKLYKSKKVSKKSKKNEKLLLKRLAEL